MALPRLALHTITTKGWSIDQCIENYARAGVSALSIWRETVQGHHLPTVRRHLHDAGLTPLSLVRGGFFTDPTPQSRQKAHQQNLGLLEEAHQLGLTSVVLVCGATPSQSPTTNRAQIAEGLAALAPEAHNRGLRLLVEPLHPIYAGDRSALCSLREACDLLAQLDHPALALALDVYHVWWESDLAEQIQRAAHHGWLEAYHICDFKPDQTDLLNDRGLMGEGCIDLPGLDAHLTKAGFQGHREVEIFSEKWWSRDPADFLQAITTSYQDLYL